MTIWISRRRRRTAPSLRPVYVGAGALVVVLAGCASAGTQASTTQQAKAQQEVEASDYCLRAAEVLSLDRVFDPAKVDPLDPAALKTAFSELRERLTRVGEVIPSEIAAPHAQIASTVEDVFAILDEVDYDFTQLVSRQDELTEMLGSEELTAAQSSIAAYDADHCDPALVDDAVRAANAGTAIGNEQLAAVVASIEDSFSAAEIQEALAFTGLSDVDALAAALASGAVDPADLDRQIQLRRDGIPVVYGDDGNLDILWDACDGGDLEACDGLYEGAPLLSDYERFAASCGDRSADPIGGRCTETLNDTGRPNDSRPLPDTETSPNTTS